MSNTNVRRIANCVGCIDNKSDVREKPCYHCTRTDSVPMLQAESGWEYPMEKSDLYMNLGDVLRD